MNAATARAAARAEARLMEHGAEPVWHRLARQRLNPAAAAPLVPDDAGAAPPAADAALLAADAAPLEADAAGAGPPAAGAAADGGEMAEVAAELAAAV